jgi:hypothetical protein
VSIQNWKFEPQFEPASGKPSPFEILGLPVDATNAEIVEREDDASAQRTDQEELLCRMASHDLLTHALTRVVYELFEIPGAQYRDPGWERFVKLHEKSPVNLKELARTSRLPRLEDFNLAAVVGLALDGLLRVPEADIAPAIEHNPFTAECNPPLEVRDVIFG